MAEGIRLLPQRQTTAVTDTGRTADVVEVQFTVDDDGPFTVTIPLGDYTPELVRANVVAMAESVRATRRAFE